MVFSEGCLWGTREGKQEAGKRATDTTDPRSDDVQERVNAN